MIVVTSAPAARGKSHSTFTSVAGLTLYVAAPYHAYPSNETAARWRFAKFIAFPGVLEGCRNGGGPLALSVSSYPDGAEVLDAAPDQPVSFLLQSLSLTLAFRIRTI